MASLAAGLRLSNHLRSNTTGLADAPLLIVDADLRVDPSPSMKTLSMG